MNNDNAVAIVMMVVITAIAAGGIAISGADAWVKTEAMKAGLVQKYVEGRVEPIWTKP